MDKKGIILNINKEKLKKFDMGACIHWAWHEACDDWGKHSLINWKYMPEKYKGSIPQDIFMFVYACQEYIKEEMIEECKE